ncbi:hypothetical protein M9Y10_014371 [Tritrichomonas musculus]|uniref:Serine/threonine-protein phosphatase n=1 Tax=Tritrichomonas musculus TaxID=1915356 RepID=A0ABR2KZC3_9EUKA
MIPVDWIIPISSLCNEITMSPVIEEKKSKMNFKLSILNTNLSTTIPFSFQLDLLTKIRGKQYIFATITFLSKEGPNNNYSFSFGGDFSVNKMSIKSSDKTRTDNTRINFNFLYERHFIYNDQLHLQISIGYVEQTFLGIPSIDFVPDPYDIVKKILAPHDTKHECPVSNSEISWVCQSASTIILNDQPCLLRLKTPIVIVGDLHGQYFDLIRIFQKYGFPNIANYLFLGDYVDRGHDSLDIIVLLLTFKILFPNNIFLLRGNHECASVTSTYGFADECNKKSRQYSNFLPVFQVLPIAAIIGNKIFCVHGGIAPSIESLDEIENFKRPSEVPSIGTMHELLWSDPSTQINGFGKNSRGSCMSFGAKAARDFLTKFGFEMLIRAHETVDEGYTFPFGKKMNIVTVFSATQYSKGHNLGAVIVIDDALNYYFDTYKGLNIDEIRKYEKTDFYKCFQEDFSGL